MGKGSALANKKDKNNYKGRILIVDDNKALTSILENRYEEKDYNVEIAINADEALIQIKAERFDLIIIDFYMDTMYANDFIKEVKKFDDSIKIIVISALKTEEQIEELLRIGADTFINKPLFPKQVDAIIKKYIGK